MKQYVMTYSEVGYKGALIQHREVFLTRLGAHINLFFSKLNKNRIWHNLKEEDR